jgi:hypothetical protein
MTQRHMLKRMMTIVALLIAGAVVNVGVAWWFACEADASKFGVPLEQLNYQYLDQSLLHGMTFPKDGIDLSSARV